MVVLAMSEDDPPLTVQIGQALGFVLCCAAGVLLVLALFLRFAHRRLPMLDPLARTTYGIYLVHYVFSIWLQYALLEWAIFAGVKAAIVFVGTLSMSFVSVAALQRIPLADRITRSRPGLTA